MPGKGSYGPGGKWVHDRAHRIMEKGETQKKYGPKRGKQIAYAIATQQAHKTGKTPKKKGGYGTKEGRSVAKAKFDKPRKEYQKTAAEVLDAIQLTRVKTAAPSFRATGRDNRTPFQGGTQFPTESSKGFARKLHGKSADKAEVGPAPLMGEMDKTKMVPLGSVVPKMPSAKGSLPMFKTGSLIADDPLVKYLQKHAKVLEDNADAFATCMIEPSLQDRDSDFSGTQAEAKKKEQDKELEALFKNYPSENVKQK